jgi:hypothetical protein
MSSGVTKRKNTPEENLREELALKIVNYSNKAPFKNWVIIHICFCNYQKVSFGRRLTYQSNSTKTKANRRKRLLLNAIGIK